MKGQMGLASGEGLVKDSTQLAMGGAGSGMRIKKFIGPSMSDCLLKVKKELGEDAIILDCRKIARGGPFSFLLSDMIEVVAARDDWATGGAGHPNASLSHRFAQQLPQLESAPTEGEAHRGAPKGQAMGHPEGPRGQASKGQAAMEGFQWALMNDELKELRDSVQEMARALKYQTGSCLPEALGPLYSALLDNGVEDAVAMALVQELSVGLKGAEYNDRAAVEKALGGLVSQALRAAWPTGVGAPGNPPRSGGAPGNQAGKGKPRVIALVGPTGVGKTTTLAKMATHPEIFGRLRVGLVSADTYRIAAVEQLKTFAAIAGLPMTAVYRPADMPAALERLKDCHVILIDTAGRSQRDEAQVRELQSYLEYAGAPEVHLALAMGTRLPDQMEILSRFSVVRPNALIFTKLDETSNFGMMLNVAYYAASGDSPAKPGSLTEAHRGAVGHPILGGPRGGGPVGVSLLTYGQEVPDDLICPTQSQLVKLVADRNYYARLVGKGMKS